MNTSIYKIEDNFTFWENKYSLMMKTVESTVITVYSLHNLKIFCLYKKLCVMQVYFTYCKAWSKLISMQIHSSSYTKIIWWKFYEVYRFLLSVFNTVEPRYNEVLGTMKITWLYQVPHYIRAQKQRNIKSWDQQNYLVIRGFCYIRSLYNEVPLYNLFVIFGVTRIDKEIPKANKCMRYWLQIGLPRIILQYFDWFYF